MSDPELCEQTFRIFVITDVRYSGGVSVGTVPYACPCIPMPAPNPKVCASRHGWAPPLSGQAQGTVPTDTPPE